MITEKNAENAANFLCEKCDFKCSKKSNYLKHLVTRKHINNDASSKNNDKKIIKKYVCNCGKEYGHRQGLYAHKKKCEMIEGNSDDNQLVNIILKDNFD